MNHSHCPHACEHPQPVQHAGTEYCGRCWFKYGEVVVMVPCTPETCEEAQPTREENPCR